MIRNPIVAGQFYPATAAKLRELIRSLVDEQAAKQDAIGAVCPHAGYVYSGGVTGATLSRINIPETCVVIGPNHTGRGLLFAISSGGSWKTPLGETQIDSEAAGEILSTSEHLREDPLAHQFEHSIEVQVPFLQYFRPDVKIVPIVLGFAGGEIYKEIGLEIARALKRLDKRVLIIASTDMTHYEPDDSARAKDRRAIEAMLALDANELLRRVEEQHISMCGYAPVTALITAARELGARKTELVSYRTSAEASGDFSSVVGYAGLVIPAASAGDEVPPDPQQTSVVVDLARRAVETYVREGRAIKPTDLAPEMRQRAGVFVSIHEPGGLRGCIGTFEPTTANVAEEIVRNAISSATRDPRFFPIRPDELPHLTYSVDVLSSPELVDDKAQLDVKKYGVIVESGWRRGLLLPDLEGVQTVDEQIDICRQKAGIGRAEPVKLYRFEVKRYR